LSEGEIDEEDCSIECWKHGSAFSLRDGSPQSLPATQPVPVYGVHREGDDVVVTDEGRT
jgi:3-phenylpropionate/trans-cinnamate dioxygenase ferredoxin subunit